MSRCYRHQFPCSHKQYSPGCPAECVRCGAEHPTPVEVHLPGEITPYVDWLPAPEPDPTYWRRMREGSMGGYVPVVAYNHKVRRLPTRGYKIIPVDAEDLGRLRLEWDVEWFRPEDGEAVWVNDQWMHVVSQVDNDDSFVVEPGTYPLPVVPPYPVGRGLAALREWRTNRAGLTPTHK